MLVVQLCPTLCNPIDYSPPDSSVHGILQARPLEWVAIPFSRGYSWLRDWTQVSCISGRFFTVWATRKARKSLKMPTFEQQQCWWSSWLWLWTLFFFLLYVKDRMLVLMHLVQVFVIVEVWHPTFPLSMGLSRCLSRRWLLKDACSSIWAHR